MREEDQENFESDEMRPDISDRAPRRERSKPQKSPMVSRQHIKIGLGILILLLLIFLVSSALKSPAPQNNGPREVNLGSTPENTSQAAQQPTDNGSATPTNVTPPPISGTPTQSPPLPETPNQQRVEIPGEVTDALSAQQEQLNRLKETEIPGANSVTTTQSGNSGQTNNTNGAEAKTPVQNTQPSSPSTGSNSQQTTNKSTPAASEPKSPSTPVAKGSRTPGTVASLAAIPGNRVTLQVSSASRSDTLLAFAKKNGMTDYWVYSTRRDGKPWFVLVTGNYASATEARAALSGMSKDVQANKPWVRSMQQVHQDLKQ